jgi:effector-binding domain-containing protein
VALSIFVATQKGEFTLERSRVINSPKSAVFNYVNETKNWEDWNSWAVEDSLMHVTLSKNTLGKGSLCSWEGKAGSGDLKTLYAKVNDSIFQTMNFNGNSSEVFMSFKDTLKGTKVTWKATGKMSFMYKIMNTFNGGAEKVIGLMFEKSLTNLDRKLDYEINTYSIKVNGVSNKLENFYLEQTFTSEISKIPKNSEIVISKITNFCKQNTITISGKQFIIYNTYDSANGLARISICIPIKEAIFIVEGSDIMSKKIKAFQAVKTTLTGDYVHLKAALDKTREFIKDNYLTKDMAFSHVEVFVTSKKEEKSPSKWITEIYIPVKPKGAAKPSTALPEVSKDKTLETSREKEIPSEF